MRTRLILLTATTAMVVLLGGGVASAADGDATRPPTAPLPPSGVAVPPPSGLPVAGDRTQAAVRFGWGAPLSGSDEFDYVGRPDTSRWHLAGQCWPGHAGNGRRCASRSTVDGSKLVMTGLANGDTGWLGHRLDRRYGRWEARVRSRSLRPGAGHQYHPVLIVWPSSDRWPQDGEYDFLESGAPGATCAEAFLHYPHPPGAVQQEHARETDCGAPLSTWHTIAFEWTPQHVAGFVDGRRWFRYSGAAGSGRRAAIQSMPSGHLTIQLDNVVGSGMTPATVEVDWVRLYR